MLIVFEGSAGSGKTTQSLLLKKYLIEEKNLKTFYSAAFEGKRKDVVSGFIDTMEMSKINDSVMFLFQALHSLQFKEVEDALKTDAVVIADRWRESFFVYHTYANTFENCQHLLEEIDKFTFKDLKVDMYIYIDVAPEVAHKRYEDREKEFGNNGLKLMSLEYFKWVSDFYLKMAKERGWVIIDGNGQIEDVFKRIVSEVNKRV